MSSLTLAAIRVFKCEVPESVQASVAPLPTNISLAVALPCYCALLLICLAITEPIIDCAFRLTITGWKNIIMLVNDLSHQHLITYVCKSLGP